MTARIRTLPRFPTFSVGTGLSITKDGNSVTIDLDIGSLTELETLE